MLFMLSMNFTEQGIRGIKDAPKRSQQARDLAKKMGCEIKQLYLTTGDFDLVAMLEAPNGDAMAKFVMALWHDRQCAHPHRACLAGRGIHETGRGTALNALGHAA
jgi:uncharacterized protein with GYD domain